jgi:hypothetical protein
MSRAKRLKPTGHSALIESMIQPAIVIGSTLMSAIAAYVLALDEITRILDRRGTPSDYFIVALCAGMGFLIDMAIIVAATRYKMHAIRADEREWRWLRLAQWVLGIGLASETMTLFYFFVHLSARAFPGPLVQLADAIHAALAVSRAFLPPIVLAYFSAGVLPILFDRADRNREIKSRTSSNIMLLIDRLSLVENTDDKAEMLRALGGQLMLDTYAQYDETGRTTEDAQLQRDAKLLTHLARIHRLDWSSIAADVAPELRHDTAPIIEAAPAPSEVPANTAGGTISPFQLTPDSGDPRPPTGPGTPTRRRGVRTPASDDASGDGGDVGNVVRLPSANSRPRRQKSASNRASGRARAGRAKGRNNVSVQDRARQAWQPGMSVAALRDAASISHGSAQKYQAMLTAETFVAESTARNAQIGQQESLRGGEDEEKEAAL